MQKRVEMGRLCMEKREYDMVMVVVLFEWNLIHVVWGAEANRKKEKGRVHQ